MKLFMTIIVLLTFFVFQGGLSPCWAGLPTGLSIYLPLAGTVSDQSGNGHDVAVHGAVSAKDLSGFPGGAYIFDGKGAWLEVQDLGLLLNYDRNWTVNFWALLNDTATGIFMAGADGDAGARQFVISSRYVKISHRADSGSDWRVNYKAAEPGVWQMYTVSWDKSGHLQVFVDGVLQGEDLVGELADFMPDNAPVIGAVNFANKTQFLQGMLGEFRVYDRVLTGAEIKQLFNIFQK